MSRAQIFKGVFALAFAQLLLLFSVAAHGLASAKAAEISAYDFILPGIGGAPLPLKAYEGRPILLVNTASRCGFTGQFAGLQSLWERFAPRGLVVIGAPSNDFRQEPKDAKEVKHFCETVFGVDFPMSDLISVRGEAAHPLFAWAAGQSRAPSWNFNKYLIGPDGRVLGHYPASIPPERLVRDIEPLLSAPD